MNSPPLILVVGMHRSGTSLLGSILEALGVAMPGPLIPGDHHNPGGYFERSDITSLQEELLIDLQRRDKCVRQSARGCKSYGDFGWVNQC